MNKKYERYIEYIVNDIKPPYFKNMVDIYGLRPDEYELVISRVYNQPVTIKGYYVGYYVNDNQGNIIYHENSNGYWEKSEYDNQGEIIYHENSNGYWAKYEYDNRGNIIYYESIDGVFIDNR